MVGIKSYGAYVPFYRLKRDELARAWGTRSSGGEKAVACYDEDSITMAMAAASDCLNGPNGQNVEALMLATSTAPYKEKLAAPIIASAIDCPRETYTADFTNSLRAGTIAINSALDAINSGRARNILVAASDCRLGTPRGELESLLGDGAAALVLGDSEVVATIEGHYSITDEILDTWRSDKDTYVRSWENRFIITQGYNKIVAETIQVLLKKHELAPKDFAKVILYAPDARSHAALAKKLGFDPKTQLQDSLIGVIGHTGVASPLMMLVAALEESKPGDRLLLASYGNGSDAFILTVTEEINRLKDRRGINKYLQSKTMPINYEKYLLWRGQIEVEPLRRLDPIAPSASALYRERKEILALYGQKCRQCGTAQYPAQRICVKCQARNDFEEYKFSDKKAKVFTYAQEQATAILELPQVVCVIDFEGGGRMQAELTDRFIDEVGFGLPVEMTFRKLGELKGIHHYFWKCKPVR